MKSYREQWSLGGIMYRRHAALLPIAPAVPKCDKRSGRLVSFCLFRLESFPNHLNHERGQRINLQIR